jgi:hypothetical protein
MKIDGKNYPIPEINIAVMKELEQYGVYFVYGETYKSILTLVSAFLCVSASITPEKANEVIEKQILSGGGLNDWLEDISNALETSEFVKQIVSKPKANKPVFKFMFKNGSELK